jgi:hypothetical protein
MTLAGAARMHLLVVGIMQAGTAVELITGTADSLFLA